MSCINFHAIAKGRDTGTLHARLPQYKNGTPPRAVSGYENSRLCTSREVFPLKLQKAKLAKVKFNRNFSKLDTTGRSGGQRRESSGVIRPAHLLGWP